MENTVSGDSNIIAVESIISRDLGGEVAIMNPKSNMLYGLSAVGTFLWNLIQEPRTVNEIRDAILEEYEVEPDRCERDLLALLRKLVTEGLIEVKGERL
jgi:hypothetical protein